MNHIKNILIIIATLFTLTIIWWASMLCGMNDNNPETIAQCKSFQSTYLPIIEIIASLVTITFIVDIFKPFIKEKVKNGILILWGLLLLFFVIFG
jgi:ABC-type multidrug transport system permease subunit